MQPEFADNGAMEKFERLKQARKLKYPTINSAAEALGIPKGTYGGHEAGTRDFGNEDARRYARAFGVLPTWLILGDGPQTLKLGDVPDILDFDEFEKQAVFQIRPGPAPGEALRPAGRSLTPIRLNGTAEAGYWRESEFIEDVEAETISAPLDAQFPSARQRAYRVGGDSMNRAEPRPIRDGDFIVCVPFEDIPIKPRTGMNVVVERRRYDGAMRELSVKQVHLYADRTEFVPMSDNPVHRPIVVPKVADPNDTTVVEILDLVRFVFDSVPVPIPDE